MLADHRYCYPLTVSDSASRFLLACDALSSTAESFAFVVCERAFKDFGLPRAIRTDNGVPFACPRALPGGTLHPFTRPYRGLEELDYPFHDHAHIVTRCGRICFGRREINLSTVFAGQKVGVKEVSDKTWLVRFMHYDLGYFDHESCRLESAENPFGAKVLPMASE